MKGMGMSVPLGLKVDGSGVELHRLDRASQRRGVVPFVRQLDVQLQLELKAKTQRYVLSSLSPLERGGNDRVVFPILIDKVLKLLHICSALLHSQRTRLPLTSHRLLKLIGNVNSLGVSNGNRLLSSLPPRVLNTLPK